MRLLAGLLIAIPVWAQAPLKVAGAGVPDKPAATISLASLNKLERKLDTALSTTGGADPLWLAGTARATYVPGCGVVVTQEASLINTPSVNPFRPEYTKEEIAKIRQRKLANLPLLRQVARSLWAAAAESLPALPDNEQIVLEVRLLYKLGEDSSGLPAHLTFKAARKAGLAGSLQMEEE